MGPAEGTAELDLETTYVTRDLAAMIQAMVVLAVSAEGGFSFWRRQRSAAAKASAKAPPPAAVASVPPPAEAEAKR